MNEMYDMSIVTHYYGVIGILVVIGLNAYMLLNAKELLSYKRQMSLFTPVGSTAIGTIIFTGVVMMAAKHLEFSIENIVMIVFALVIIVLEVKRATTLKYLNPKIDGALEGFKKFGMKILLYEVLVVLSISIWMWI